MKRLAPKVLVRITWLPASTYARATSSTFSGWVRFQASGQAPSGSPRCWSWVPQAPSVTTGPADVSFAMVGCMADSAYELWMFALL